MRTLARDATEVYANLLPIPLLFNKIQFYAASRLATLPTSHPLHPFIYRASKHYVCYHRSPLHHLLYYVGIPALLLLEFISLICCYSNFISDLTVIIPPDKPSAIAQAKIFCRTH